MIRTTGRRPLTCHHEAGHALVRWYFGHRTDRAVVLTVEEVCAGRQVENRRGVMVACEGLVDGYDISTLPRQIVRSRLVGVPQDAYLFPGTVQDNVDPFGTASESDMMDALECVQLWDVISRKGGLDSDIDEWAVLILLVRSSSSSTRISGKSS